MKKLIIIVCSIALTMMFASLAFAQAAPVKQEPSAAINPSGLTLNDCLTVLTGLNALDGYQVVVNAGKPNEQVIVRSYEFSNGDLRGDIADNIATLTAIQKTAQEAQAQIFRDVAKGETEIKPGTPQVTEYDRQLKELTTRSCSAQLKKIKTSDLKLNKNEIPGSVLAALDKIREK